MGDRGGIRRLWMGVPGGPQRDGIDGDVPALRLILRALLLGMGLPVLLAGAVGLGHAYAPESSATRVFHGIFVELVGGAPAAAQRAESAGTEVPQ